MAKKNTNTSLTESFLSGMSSKKDTVRNSLKNEKESKDNRNAVMAGGAMKGLTAGILGTAAGLGTVSALKGGKGVGKYLGKASSGALGTFNPKEVASSFKNTRKFQKSNLLGKGLQLATGGKQLAQDYGTQAGLAVGGLSAGIGAHNAKKNYEAAQLYKQQEKKACSYEAEIYKEAALGALLGSATKAIGSFGAQSLGKRVAIGAGVGAGAGALTSKPTVDENGKAKSNLLSGALSGAVTGAATGALLKSSPKTTPGSANGSPNVVSAAKGGNVNANTVMGSTPTSATPGNVSVNSLKSKSISDIAQMNTRNIPKPKRV